MPLFLFPLWWLVTLSQIVGTATVIDGDTIEIRGQRIRLHGIDAPESSQWCSDASEQKVRCGQQAALRLDSLLQGRTCQCEVLDTDRYGRKIATCRVGEININEWMVTQGQALAYRQYSADYVSLEQKARAARRGIWQYQFDEPWNWRAQKRSSSVKRSVNRQPNKKISSTECNIKGNISRSGEKIYHTLDSPWYEKTQIDESTEERWFCSETEAKQAGWRAAKY